jgi:hypothetical protein
VTLRHLIFILAEDKRTGEIIDINVPVYGLEKDSEGRAYLRESFIDQVLGKPDAEAFALRWCQNKFKLLDFDGPLWVPALLSKCLSPKPKWEERPPPPGITSNQWSKRRRYLNR